jgi:hypothetical protein
MNTSYTTCARCGEPSPAALHWHMKPILCRNCAAARIGAGPGFHTCVVCGRKLPAEAHHIASRVSYPEFTARLCLNCHAIITARQYIWRSTGVAERHPFAYLLVGVFDVLRLFAERSPAWEICRYLFAMLADALLLVLGALRLSALCDVGLAISTMEGDTSYGV